MDFKKYKKTFINIIPGFIACCLITIISKFLERFAGVLGAPTIAIFLGILLGNTILNQKILDKGTKFSEGTLLSISVVLLGSTLNINSILTLGTKGIFYIVLQMAITIFAVIWIGRKMKFSYDFTLLMASGNSVCGSSAIASTSPAIGANDKEKGIAITLVNVSGTFLMLILPIVAYLTFDLNHYKTSALLGGILQSVGQVVASGKMISPDVTELSTIFKIVRIMCLVFVVIYLSYLKNKNIKNNNNKNTKCLNNKAKIQIPWYVIGFFIACGLFTIGVIPNKLSFIFKSIGNNFEIIALAAIGMRVKVLDLISHGIKYTVYAALICIVQVIIAIGLIKILF